MARKDKYQCSIDLLLLIKNTLNYLCEFYCLRFDSVHTIYVCINHLDINSNISMLKYNNFVFEYFLYTLLVFLICFSLLFAKWLLLAAFSLRLVKKN